MELFLGDVAKVSEQVHLIFGVVVDEVALGDISAAIAYSESFHIDRKCFSWIFIVLMDFVGEGGNIDTTIAFPREIGGSSNELIEHFIELNYGF